MSFPWLLSLAALLILPPSAVADVAVLIEARKQGDALRMVIDAERQRALIATPRGQSVIDLERKRIYVRGAAGGRQLPIERGGAASLGAYRVTPWGPGPVIADHATVYHVITYHEEICAEMLGLRLDAAVHGAGSAGAGSARRLARARAGPRLRAHSVRRIRRGRLADAGRQDRPSGLRDQGDPLRVRPQPGELSTRDDRRLTDIREAIWPAD